MHENYDIEELSILLIEEIDREEFDNENFIEVKRLLKHGADIHTQDDSALITSAYYGRLEVVKYLIKHGADIHAGNDEALSVSAQNGCLELVEYLVSKGCNDIIAMDNGNDIVKQLIVKLRYDNLENRLTKKPQQKSKASGKAKI